MAVEQQPLQQPLAATSWGAGAQMPALLVGHLPLATGPEWSSPRRGPQRTGEAAEDMEQWLGQTERCKKLKET